MSSKIAAVPFYSVELNGTTIKDYSPNLQIIQEINKHPIALVDVLYKGNGAANSTTQLRTSWAYWKEKTPIRITYGMSPTYLASMLGYVASYSVVKTGTDDVYPGVVTTRVQYTIVGTSMSMQSTVNYAWKNISPSAIASKIAVKNGLRAIVHPYSTVYDYRLQNCSDFQFLTALAQEIGYQFYIDNTDLYFINPNLVLGQTNVRNVPQFWMLGTPGIKDTLEEFKPIVGTTTATKYVASRSMMGINPNTSVLVNANQRYDLYEAFSDIPTVPTLSKYVQFPVESYAEAQERLTASTNINQFWSTATAKVWGDYRVKPNNLVEFTGQALPETEAGQWLVQKAVHNMYMPPLSGNLASGKYEIDMTVARNQSYTINVVTPNAVAPVMQIVPSKLVNGVWRSSNVGAQVYAG